LVSDFYGNGTSVLTDKSKKIFFGNSPVCFNFKNRVYPGPGNKLYFPDSLRREWKI